MAWKKRYKQTEEHKKNRLASWYKYCEKYGYPNIGIKYSKKARANMKKAQQKYFKEHPEAIEKMRLRANSKENIERMRKLGKSCKGIKRNKETCDNIGRGLKKVYDERKRVAWQTGLTKETHNGLKRMSENKKGKHSSISTEFKKGEMDEIIKKSMVIRKPNKPEMVMNNIIKKNNLPFNYVGNGKIWFRNKNNTFNPDFLSKNPKHIIEVFGDYWHNREDMKKRDIIRLKTYSKYGYKTLIIWQHELRNPNQVLKKVKNFINT